MSSSELPYRLEKQGGHLIVALQSELNALQWSDIERLGGNILTELESLKPPVLLVDLAALDYMASAQVALLVRWWKSIRDRHGRMAVVIQHPMVREVITIAGLNKVWTIVDKRDDGLRALGISPGRQRGAIWSGAAGLVAVALAVAALVLDRTSNPLLGEATLPALYGLSAVALLCGIAAVVIGQGLKRIVGVAVVLASLGLLASGAFSLP